MPAPWLLPAIIGGLGLWAGSRKRKNPYQDVLRQYPLPAGFNPFAPSIGTSESFGTTATSGTEWRDILTQMEQEGLTAPYITPEYRGVEGLTRGLVGRRLAAPSALPAGYAVGGLRNINEAHAAASRNVQNRLAAMGLAGSPAAATILEAAERPRAAQSADFLTSLPLLERQLETEDIGLGERLAAAFGRGQREQRRGTTRETGTIRRTGTGTTSGTTTSTGGPQGFPPGYMEMLLGAGQQQPGFLDNLYSQLLFLYGAGLLEGGGGGGHHT